MGLTFRGLTPGRDEISHAPRTAWGLPSPLYYRYRVTFPWVKRPGSGVDHPSSSEVKERVDLYLYHSLGLHGLF